MSSELRCAEIIAGYEETKMEAIRVLVWIIGTLNPP